jgi:hypothetical protein
MVGRGEASRSRKDTVRFGSLSCGQFRYGGQVRVWSDKFGSGMAVRDRYGRVRFVRVRFVVVSLGMAVVFRCALVW